LGEKFFAKNSSNINNNFIYNNYQKVENISVKYKSFVNTNSSGYKNKLDITYFFDNSYLPP